MTRPGWVYCVVAIVVAVWTACWYDADEIAGGPPPAAIAAFLFGFFWPLVMPCFVLTKLNRWAIARRKRLKREREQALREAEWERQRQAAAVRAAEAEIDRMLERPA